MTDKKQGHKDRLWTGELKDTIRGYAILDAVKSNSRARVNAIIGKVMSSNPELRERKSDVLDIINGIIEEVNKLPPKEQQKEMDEKYADLLVEKPREVKKKELPKLKDVGKSPVLRF